MAAATENMVLDTRKERASGLYPVRLRITYLRESKYYPVQYVPIPEYEAARETLPEKFKFTPGQLIYLNEDDYSRIMGERPRKPYSTISLIFAEYKKRARNILDKMPLFSFEKFEKKYLSNKTDPNDVFSMLRERAKELRDGGRISTAVTFECTLSSLKKFAQKEKLSFNKITVPFLSKYEAWMLTPKKPTGKKKAKRNTLTTVGIYLRNLRTVYNRAIKTEIVSIDQYPFKKDEYQIPAGPNVKKALTLEEIKQIAGYDATPGINVKDMARLKYSNIDGQIIRFVRSKTEKERRKKQKPIEVFITKATGRIIDTWGNKPAAPDEYIFPILSPGMTPQQEYDAIKGTTKLINTYIKTIGENIGIPEKITTYVARHSFATVLKRSGASTEFISESLGHSSLAVTENYLDSFETEEKKKWSEMLLPEKQ
jgi:integrase